MGSRELWRVCEQGRAMTRGMCMGRVGFRACQTDCLWVWLWGADLGRHALGHPPLFSCCLFPHRVQAVCRLLCVQACQSSNPIMRIRPLGEEKASS